MRNIFVFCIVFAIFLTGVASASFNIGNLSSNIETNYGPSENIRGWVNISLQNEPTNSVFSDSFENSITLIDLLNLNGFSLNGSCSTRDCGSDYSANNGEQTKNFSLGYASQKIIGFKLTGDIKSIDSVNFTIESNAPSSCINQLKIDILNDGEIDTGNYKSGEGTCANFNSCFNISEESTEVPIGVTPFCQKMNLPESPGFTLGAWIKEFSNSTKTITMALYSLHGGDPLATCNLNSTSGEGEKSCSVNYLVKKSEEYYVCIYSDKSDMAHKIRGYIPLDSSKACGFNGQPTYGKKATAAYQIFANGKRFGGVGALNINNSLSGGKTTSDKIKDYIINKHGSLNCSNDCVIPIKIISNLNQSITLKGLSIVYGKTDLPGIIENKFYDLEETPAVINLNFKKIYLDKSNFSVPSSYGNHTFTLEFSGEDIVSKKIIVEKVPIINSLSPTSTASAYPTIFTVILDSPGNITKYEWDFGDNKTEISSTNKITHIYSSKGNYKMKITITDKSQKTSYKTFDITVNTPEKIINSTIKEMKEDLTNISEELKKFTSFEQQKLNSALDIENLNKAITELERDFKIKTSEAEINEIMSKLVELKVPKSVMATSSSADYIPFLPKNETIDMEFLKSIGGGNYDSNREEEYKTAVIFWMFTNIDTALKFKEFSAIYKQSEEPILSIFELKISEKKSVDYDYFLIISGLDNLEFDSNYLEREKDGAKYITLKEDNYKILFSTTEEVDFFDLPLFISPEISKLDLVEKDIPSFIESHKKWYVFSLVIAILLVLGLIVYILLQRWYKVKYENYLFKERNNLYNLMTYMENSKKNGLSEEMIKSSLKKSGWNSEQIAYVIKKYQGKRTGMFEISLGKIFGMIKRRKQPPQAIGRVPNMGGLGFNPQGHGVVR